MKRTKHEAALTRAGILDAASTVFRSQGYASTTLEDIARHAGVTRGAVYWHFENKYDILFTLIRDYTPNFVRRSREILCSERDPVSRVQELLSFLIKDIDSNKDIREMEEISIMMKENPAEYNRLHSLLEEKNLLIYELFLSAIREGMTGRQMRQDLDPESTALALTFLIKGLWTRWLERPGSFSPQVVADPIINILMAGIRYC